MTPIQGNTRTEIISAALRIIGVLKEGRYPSQSQCDSAEFHLRCLEQEFSTYTASQLSVELASRLQPRYPVPPPSGPQFPIDDWTIKPTLIEYTYTFICEVCEVRSEPQEWTGYQIGHPVYPGPGWTFDGRGWKCPEHA